MTDFQTLQTHFQTALLKDHTPPLGLLNPKSEAQFDVYLNAYRARLRSALRENYEILPLVMGDDAFDELANAYIQDKPSTHYSLRWYGHQLSDFMVDNDDLVQHPAMQDLACIEWALRNAFDAAKARLLTPDEVAALAAEDWPDLRFVLHPSVQLLNLHWAVGPVLHALKAGQEEIPVPDALVHAMLVWREGMLTQWKSLTDAEASFVKSLQKGHTFGQLCETLAQQLGEDQAAPMAVAILRELLQTGAISSMDSLTHEPVSA